MHAISVCIAASVLLCLVSSPVAARQLRQEANAPVASEATAAPPVITEATPSPPATTDETASPTPATVILVDNTTADSSTTTGADTMGGAMAQNYTAAFPSIVDAVSAANTTAAGNMSILMSAIEASGVAGGITNDTAWTILAPNNAAFEKTLAALDVTAEDLLANQTLLTTILSYHVIPAAAINSSSLTPGASVATLLPGANLTVDITNMTGTPNVTFIGDSNNASVLVPDIIAGNSTIHVIDSVLLPPANATLPGAGGDNATDAITDATAGNVTVIVLNGTTNEMSPPAMEPTTASPPAADTTGSTGTTDTTGAPGTTGTTDTDDATGAAGTTPADTTGAAGATPTGDAGATGTTPTDTTSAAGMTPTGDAATDATGGTTEGTAGNAGTTTP